MYTNACKSCDKKHGEVAIAAMFKDLKQTNKGAVAELNHPVVKPIDPKTMTEDERKRVLNAVNSIKEKRDAYIKGRTCIAGSQQKKYLTEDDTVAAPTQTLYGFLTTCMMDAEEKTKVITFDVTGAFFQPEIPRMKNIKEGEEGTIIMKIVGDVFVDIMCEINPTYKDYVLIHKGRKILYVEVLRSIYGCIEAALLWYNYYRAMLEDLGFEINPYDRCIANQVMDGKQCTLTWYVDDNKISHTDDAVLWKIIHKLEEKLGKFKIYTGNEHKFFGMELIFTEDGRVKVRTKEHLLEAIDMLGEAIDFTVTTPAGRHLFQVDPEGQKLEETRKKIPFHNKQIVVC